MANLRASIVVRTKGPKRSWLIANGKTDPAGSYYVRYSVGSTPRYEFAGATYEEAEAKQIKIENRLKAASIGAVLIEDAPTDTKKSHRIEDVIAVYLDDLRLNRRPAKSINSKKTELEAFTNPAGGQTVFVTIYDPNLTGGTQPVQVEPTNVNATTPGYVYLGTLTSNAYDTSTGAGGIGSSSGSSGTGGPSDVGGLTTLTRQSVSFTTASIAPNATTTGFVNVAKSFALFQIYSSNPCRVVLYGNATAQLEDAGRPASTQPSIEGVLADVTLADESLLGSPPVMSVVFTPPVIGANSDDSLSSTVYFSVTNDDVNTEPITVDLVVLPFEL
jgi:hypothetical protein